MKWCIIESSEYEDTIIDNLPGVKNSVNKLDTALENDLKLDKNSKVILRNERQSSLLNKIVQFTKKVPESETLVVYFCGHGIRIGEKLYLLVKDTMFNLCEHTSVSIDAIVQIISNEYKGKDSLIILDCCYSGIATMGQNDCVESEIQYQSGRVILSSCSENQSAIHKNIDNTPYAIFTYCFSDVLSKGIPNADKYISILEMVDKIQVVYKKLVDKEIHFKSTEGADSRKLILNAAFLREQDTKNNEDLLCIRNKIINRVSSLKVLLVKTAIKYPTRDNDFGIPLGLWVLKNYLMVSMPNIEVDILDERLENRTGNSNFDFAQRVEKYDVVGISLCSCEVPLALKKFKIAHEMGKITIAGGIFTYSNEESLLNVDYIDYVIPGVGTKPIKDLFSSLIMGRKLEKNLHINHVYTKGYNTSIWVANSLPQMETHTWDEILERYSVYLNHNEFNRIDISTSRGCNKNCSFCSVRREAGQPILNKKSKMVIDEIEYLYSKGIRYFSIKDEDFYLHGCERADEIFEYFKTYDDIHFKIRMRLDHWKNNSPDFDKMKKWGIDEIQYGVESTKNEILQVLNKGVKIDYKKLKSLFNEHMENGIIVNASLILATSELEDKDYCKKLQEFVFSFADNSDYFKPYLNFFTPHPFNSRINFEGHTIVLNDLNCYTHKIPVAYPAKVKRLERKEIIHTYEKISKHEKWQKYNPEIPNFAKTAFENGNAINKLNLMEILK